MTAMKADRSTHKPSFTVGDIVYVYHPVVTPGRQRTFIRPWVGTFYIAQKLSPLDKTNKAIPIASSSIFFASEFEIADIIVSL
jgi:hypothetical protein